MKSSGHNYKNGSSKSKGLKSTYTGGSVSEAMKSRPKLNTRKTEYHTAQKSNPIKVPQRGKK